jgi:hypothetical protein
LKADEKGGEKKRRDDPDERCWSGGSTSREGIVDPGPVPVPLIGLFSCKYLNEREQQVVQQHHRP